MPFYDIKCTKCSHEENWTCTISTYSKDINEKKCPSCGANLQQDFTHNKFIISQGVEGYSKIKPSILKAESDALRENDYLQKASKKDKKFIKHEDKLKRLQEKGYF